MGMAEKSVDVNIYTRSLGALGSNDNQYHGIP